MDGSQIALVIFLASIAVMVAVLLVIAQRLHRKAKNLRSEISRQRRDALRSINLMLQQMDYDAEVLHLLRHARASRERGNETDFNGALDTLITKEREMMDRVDRVAEFEGYLQQTYGSKGLWGKLGREQGTGNREQGAGNREQGTGGGEKGTGSREPGAESAEPGSHTEREVAGELKVLLDKGGERDADAAPPATPEELKSDIQTFIRDLERIRGGELGLLDGKISFFERWVEGPERQDILRSLRAMALFLDKGDASGLEKLKKEGAGGRVQGAGGTEKEKN